MFTGIVETVGIVEKIIKDQSNIHFRIASSISKECKIDQSISHNGVCLTITNKDDEGHWVTAIQETLDKSNLAFWTVGTEVNIERCMQMGSRLDGHIVQGHVDGIGICTQITNNVGSWLFEFSFDKKFAHLMVPKGSVCINGVSLTVNEPRLDTFYVAIIPYTYEHTNFHSIDIGTKVNLEFDIIGKYMARYREIIQNP